MAVPPRLVHQRRATITDLPLYYSGHLLKKHKGDKVFKKFYGELRGAVLFLYENDSQETYTEKLDLDQLKSMQLDSPFPKAAPAIFTFKTSTKEVQLKMDNPDSGEEWRGYILTVVQKEVPSVLRLLPGQILQLQETLAQEKKRTSSGPHPPLPPRPAFLNTPSTNNQGMPECFFSVSRQEAEQMLEKNPEFGSIILRPSSRANNYGLTLRQLTSSGPALKNYRVTSIPNSGFIIELDSPVKVGSLQEVINYVLKKTEYRLQPYILCPSQRYDTKLEKPLVPPSTKPSPPPKNIPKAEVAPTVHKKKDSPVAWEVKPGDGDYLVPDDDSKSTKSAEPFNGELFKAVQKRRAWIYSNEDNQPTYEENP